MIISNTFDEWKKQTIEWASDNIIYRCIFGENSNRNTQFNSEVADYVIEFKGMIVTMMGS